MKEKIQQSYFLLFLFLLMPAYTYVVEPNTVVATINVGVNPAGVAITSDSHTAYVANSNNYITLNEDTVSVVNLKKNEVRKTITHSSFNQPYTITLNHNETRAYVTNSNSSTVSIIDTTINEVIDVIDGFDGPSGMVIAKGNIAYVNNYGGPEGVQSGNGTTLSVVDLNTHTIIGTIVVGLAPAALALSPDKEFVYVINYTDGNPGTGTLSIVQTSTNTVVAVIPGFFGPFGIAITPNGKYAYVTNFGSNNFSPIGSTVSVVNLKKRQIVATIDVGLQPAGIAITPNGRFAYVSNFNTLYADLTDFTGLMPGQGSVNIIDIATNKLLPITIPTGESPHGITIAPNGKHAYVANYAYNTLDVIKIKHAHKCGKRLHFFKNTSNSMSH